MGGTRRMLNKDTIDLAERIRKALKYLYIHLGEAQSIVALNTNDDVLDTMYSNQETICKDLIDILENPPKSTTPSAHSSSTTYRLADGLCTPTMTERKE